MSSEVWASLVNNAESFFAIACFSIFGDGNSRFYRQEPIVHYCSFKILSYLAPSKCFLYLLARDHACTLDCFQSVEMCGIVVFSDISVMYMWAIWYISNIRVEKFSGWITVKTCFHVSVLFCDFSLTVPLLNITNWLTLVQYVTYCIIFKFDTV